MEYATLVVLLALLQYIFFTARTGLGRGKYNIEAPTCSGDETWNRLFRVQQNTLEQLIIFIPATYAFAYYVSGRWVWVPGAIFIVGRFLYAAAYVKDPKTRGPGMIVTFATNGVLVLAALVGLIMGMM